MNSFQCSYNRKNTSLDKLDIRVHYGEKYKHITKMNLKIIKVRELF